jgi:hypothetical protein
MNLLGPLGILHTTWSGLRTVENLYIVEHNRANLFSNVRLPFGGSVYDN